MPSSKTNLAFDEKDDVVIIPKDDTGFVLAVVPTVSNAYSVRHDSGFPDTGYIPEDLAPFSVQHVVREETYEIRIFAEIRNGTRYAVISYYRKNRAGHRAGRIKEVVIRGGHAITKWPDGQIERRGP